MCVAERKEDGGAKREVRGRRGQEEAGLRLPAALGEGALLGSRLPAVSLDGDTWQGLAQRSGVAAPHPGATCPATGCPQENTYTIVTSKKTLYLFNVANGGQQQQQSQQPPGAPAAAAPAERSLELAFQEHYGALVQHQWFGDGFIMLGFRAGHVVVISSHSREIREELHSDKLLASLAHMSYCPGGWRGAAGRGQGRGRACGRAGRVEQSNRSLLLICCRCAGRASSGQRQQRACC